MSLTLDMMAGPTAEARVLQLTQCQLLDKFYETLHATPKELTREERYAHPSVVIARDAYNQSVTNLVALLGPEANCHQVDTELWEVFHDVYKGNVGCRPGAHWTVAQVNDYLARPHESIAV